uniref:NADH-ubiquinone oxidoreductase chain 4 n=1 Tax=Tanacetum cinerariifolium TaxID=118510 RepID=A0A6L2K1F9_TANCI|nr:NADH dehydrogenase subunit 4, mitochondrial [Tanacetum cinerariifolium]
MRAGWSSAEGSRIGMIGKDQSNLNRSHHSSSSVKAAGPYGQASLVMQAALFATTREAKDYKVQDENTCIDSGTTDLQILLTTEFSERCQIFLWIAFFASFAVKVPMVPVHILLPEAHVEAPMAGSVILAGILLKLGTYGILRFSIPMFYEATLCFTPFIYTLSTISIIYTSLKTLRQIDLKKIIAYSSVAHMNLVTIGEAVESNQEELLDSKTRGSELKERTGEEDDYLKPIVQ